MNLFQHFKRHCQRTPQSALNNAHLSRINNVKISLLSKKNTVSELCSISHLSGTIDQLISFFRPVSNRALASKYRRSLIQSSVKYQSSCGTCRPYGTMDTLDRAPSPYQCQLSIGQNRALIKISKELDSIIKISEFLRHLSSIWYNGFCRSSSFATLASTDQLAIKQQFDH